MQPTKRKILNAVIAHLKDQSNIERITLTKIAHDAGIGKSTVYEYFSNKDALILETHLYLLEQYEEILMAPILSTSFKEAFIEQLSKLLTVIGDAQTIMDAIMNRQRDAFIGMNDILVNRIKDLQMKMEVRFQDLFLMGYREGIVLFTQENIYQKNVIQALISGLLYQFVNREIDIDSQDLYELIYDSILMVMHPTNK